MASNRTCYRKWIAPPHCAVDFWRRVDVVVRCRYFCNSLITRKPIQLTTRTISMRTARLLFVICRPYLYCNP